MIDNPIIRKELLSALRTRKAALMQAMFLGLAAALIWLHWPSSGLQDIGGQQAHRILSMLAIGQLVMIALCAPAFTAASLTSETERNTLESLFATSLRPHQIAFGKMVGSLGFLVLMVLSGIPALALPFLLGGVRGTDVLAAVGLLLLTAVYLGMIGLLISSFMHRSYRAIIMTYAVLLVIFFLVAIPAWPISRNLISRAGSGWQVALHVVASLSPLEAMLSLIWQDSTYTIGARNMPPFWQLYIPLSCAVTAATAVVCLIKLRRPVAPPRPREKLKVVERGRISARSFMFLVDPRKRKRMIRWWQNPVLIKEFRSRPMLQAQWLLRAIGICLIVSVVLMLVMAIGVEAWVMQTGAVQIQHGGRVTQTPGMYPMMATTIAGLMVTLVLLVGPAITGGAICADRESGVWDLIRTTTMPSWRIVSGKFQASIIPLLLLVLAMVPAMIILLCFELDLWLNVVLVLVVVGMTVLFVGTAGTFFSSLFSKTSTATAWTYALVITIGLLTLLVLLGRESFSYRLIEAVFVLNPVAAAMDAAGHPGMQEFGLMGRHLKIMGIATAVMFVITVARVFQLRRRD